MDITILEIERTTSNDEVITAHWNALLSDGEFTVRSYGSQSFTRNEASPEFIAFEDLTEEIVVGWLTLDEGLEANLQAQIDEKKSPSMARGVPWNSVEVVEVVEEPVEA